MKKSTPQYLLALLLLLTCTFAISACEPSSDSNQSNDTGSTYDSWDSGPSDNIKPPKLSPPYDNRCANTYSPIELPALSPDLLEVPDHIEAHLKWAQAPSCAGAPGRLTSAPYYGGAALSEDVSGATIVAEYGYSWGSGYGTGAVTYLSANEGTPLGCELFPADGFSTGTPLMLHPALDDAPLLAAFQSDWGHGGGVANPNLYGWGISWYSTAWDTQLQGMGGPLQTHGGGAFTKLLPDGQLLIFRYAEHILSIDSYTGELNWIVTPEDVGFPNNIDLRTIAYRAEHEDFVVQFHVPVESVPYKFFAIDRCGLVETITQEAFHAAIRIEFGDGYLIPIYTHNPQTPGRFDLRIESKNGELRHTYKDCERSVSLAQDAVACFRTIPNSHEIGSDVGSKGLEISTIRWGHEQATAMILESSEEGERTFFNINSPVSLRDGVLLLTQNVDPIDEHGVSTSDATTRLFFVNWQTAQVLKTFDMPWVRGQPPLISENGMLIFNYDMLAPWAESSKLYGIQTNLHGLSPTAFPRGLALGRNRNLGAYFHGGVED